MKPAKLLAIASAQGNVAAVEQILRADPTVARDWQPIMDACHFGQVEIVNILLERGADPNIISKSTFRYRPLHRTVEHKVTTPRGPRHLAIVRILLDSGGDPMLRGCLANVTPLALAALTGETQFIPILREKMPEGLDIFHAAVLCDQERIKALVAQHPTLATAKDENGWTAIQYAGATQLARADPIVRNRQSAIIRMLVEIGADPSEAVGYAFWSLKDPGLADFLLTSGGKLEDGDIIVHTAENGPGPLMDLFVKHAVDLYDTRGTEHHGGYNPLGCVLTMRKTDGAHALLELGVDPNRPSGPRSETALHVAAKYGCDEKALKLLLTHGADLDAINSDGETPLALSISAGKPKAAAFLAAQGART